MKLFIVKEPSLLRDGIVRILQEGFANHEIEAYGSDDFLSLHSEKNMADLIIIDSDTNINSKLLVDLYQSKNKKVIVWTSSLEISVLRDLFKLTLDGYFFNGMDKQELLYGVHCVLNEETYIHHSLLPILVGDYLHINEQIPNKPVGVFSEREWEVLELLTKGFKNEQIGKFLFISEKTVKNYVSSILKKMDVADRTNAVLIALRNNWITI